MESHVKNYHGMEPVGENTRHACTRALLYSAKEQEVSVKIAFHKISLRMRGVMDDVIDARVPPYVGRDLNGAAASLRHTHSQTGKGHGIDIMRVSTLNPFLSITFPVCCLLSFLPVPLCSAVSSSSFFPWKPFHVCSFYIVQREKTGECVYRSKTYI